MQAETYEKKNITTTDSNNDPVSKTHEEKYATPKIKIISQPDIVIKLNMNDIDPNKKKS